MLIFWIDKTEIRQNKISQHYKQHYKHTYLILILIWKRDELNQQIQSLCKKLQRHLSQLIGIGLLLAFGGKIWFYCNSRPRILLDSFCSELVPWHLRNFECLWPVCSLPMQMCSSCFWVPFISHCRPMIVSNSSGFPIAPIMEHIYSICLIHTLGSNGWGLVLQ